MDQAEPRDLAALLLPPRRHWWTSLTLVAAFLALAVLFTMIVPRRYTAEAALSFDPQAPLIKGGGPVPLTDAQRDAAIDAQLAAVATPAVAQEVARSVDLTADRRLAAEAERIVADSERKLGRTEALGMALLDHVQAARVGQTQLFTIRYTDGNADQAAGIANGFAASYLRAAVAQKMGLADSGAQQLDTRIADLRRQLRDADGKLAAFRLANDLLDAPDSLALEQEVAAARGQLAEARGQAALATTRSMGGVGPAGGGAVGAGTVVGGGYGGSVDTTPVSALTQQRAASAADLAALLGRYGEKHPDVIAARKKLAESDTQLAEAMHANRSSALVEARSASARAGALADSVKDADARMAATLSHSAQLLDLQNSALALRQAYQDLLKIRADQTAQLALVQPDAQLIAAAAPPMRPRFPRLGIDLAAGLLLGLGSAFAVAFIRDHWRHRLATSDDIARWLEVDYFAPLPELTAGLRADGPADPAAAILLRPDAIFADSFRSLANAALFATGTVASGGGRVIGIASALAGEGKTTTAIAMGRVLALAGTAVVLVDADPGRSASVILAGDAKIGWREVIGGQARLDEVLRREDTSGLAIVPGSAGHGIGDPAAFGEIIAALRRDYAVVIIDGPAVLTPGIDPTILRCADALVLLARWRSTPVKTVRAALRHIGLAGGRVCGVALSRVGRG